LIKSNNSHNGVIGNNNNDENEENTQNVIFLKIKRCKLSLFLS